MREFKGHLSSVNTVAFSDDGLLLATGSDNEIRLWNALDGSVVLVIVGHEARINDLIFTPDSTKFIPASDDSTMGVWRVSDGSLIQILDVHTSGVKSLGITEDGKTLITGSRDMSVSLWAFTD